MMQRKCHLSKRARSNFDFCKAIKSCSCFCQSLSWYNVSIIFQLWFNLLYLYRALVRNESWMTLDVFYFHVCIWAGCWTLVGWNVNSLITFPICYFPVWFWKKILYIWSQESTLLVNKFSEVQFSSHGESGKSLGKRLWVTYRRNCSACI